MAEKEFTASNGCRVARIATADDGGRLTLVAPSAYNNQQKGTSTSYLLDMQVDALREFFRQERDTELGRWRDPKNPTRVAALRPEGRLYVYDERTMRYSIYTITARGPVRFSTGDFGFDDTAARYLAENPIRQPWHDAKPGEVWVLTVGGGQIPCSVEATGPDFVPIAHGLWATLARGSERITAGRRIWPEPTDATP